jgi:hypothetical protein
MTVNMTSEVKVNETKLLVLISKTSYIIRKTYKKSPVVEILAK